MIPRIRKVQIRNFKSFDRAVVDLEPLTVFVGPNGVGKSNFAEALLLLQQVANHGVNRVLQRHSSSLLPRWTDRVSNEERFLGLRFNLDLEGGSQADYAVEIRVDQRSLATVYREHCRVERDQKPVAIFEVAEGHFVREIAGIRAQIAPDRLALFAASATEEFRPVYDFLSSIRAYSISPTAVDSVPSAADSGLSLELAGGNAAAVLKSVIERSPEDHKRIARLLGQAVEGITAVGVGEGSGTLHIEFERDLGLEQPGRFAADSMSDGTLRLLGLLLAIYQPSRPSVLIIEEPEATVHPAVAQLVTEILLDASKDRQVLITTHSPDILDSKELSDEQIRVVSQRHGRTVVAPLSTASRQAIREHLYTPGELLRINELEQNADQAVSAAEGLELFPPFSIS